MAKIDCWGKAEAHLAELYGDNSRIAARFLTEKRWLEKFGAAEYRHLGALATLPLLPVPGARVQILRHQKNKATRLGCLVFWRRRRDLNSRAG